MFRRILLSACITETVLGKLGEDSAGVCHSCSVSVSAKVPPSVTWGARALKPPSAELVWQELPVGTDGTSLTSELSGPLAQGDYSEWCPLPSLVLLVQRQRWQAAEGAAGVSTVVQALRSEGPRQARGPSRPRPPTQEAGLR